MVHYAFQFIDYQFITKNILTEYKNEEYYRYNCFRNISLLFKKKKVEKKNENKNESAELKDLNTKK
jgi:hypothetical protein